MPARLFQDEDEWLVCINYWMSSSFGQLWCRVQHLICTWQQHAKDWEFTPWNLQDTTELCAILRKKQTNKQKTTQTNTFISKQRTNKQTVTLHSSELFLQNNLLWDLLNVRTLFCRIPERGFNSHFQCFDQFSEFVLRWQCAIERTLRSKYMLTSWATLDWPCLKGMELMHASYLHSKTNKQTKNGGGGCSADADWFVDEPPPKIVACKVS